MLICLLFRFVIRVLSSYFALSICIFGPFPSLSCTWFQVPPLLFCFMMYLAPQHPCYIRVIWFQVSKLNWCCFLFEWIFCMLSWDLKIISKCSNTNYFKASQSGNSLARMDKSKKGLNACHHLWKYWSWFASVLVTHVKALAFGHVLLLPKPGGSTWTLSEGSYSHLMSDRWFILDYVGADSHYTLNICVIRIVVYSLGYACMIFMRPCAHDT